MMMEKYVRYKLIFHGLVQGVGFRYDLSVLANQANLTGWVMNRSDDTVEAEVQGNPEAIELVLETIAKMPPIEITRIDKTSLPLKPDEGSFRTIYY